MCGIVAGISNRDIIPVLIQGLKRLEYRGYDSSGLAILTKNSSFQRVRSVGRVDKLEKILATRKNKRISQWLF